ncbi:hypothetical protein DPEC_G00227800 [Dallia pectoralis]|uniref:Uncharacterized protein n=1 Tax=Dallia pectoralis TaxID=75939 RepID=A0ACC2G1F5_DALPE|nr:hypothetical protein DPEC_G00227800 [Dallia pectoralis]
MSRPRAPYKRLSVVSWEIALEIESPEWVQLLQHKIRLVLWRRLNGRWMCNTEKRHSAGSARQHGNGRRANRADGSNGDGSNDGMASSNLTNTLR